MERPAHSSALAYFLLQECCWNSVLMPDKRVATLVPRLHEGIRKALIWNLLCYNFLQAELGRNRILGYI
jgi:hypothetical protein